VTTGPGVINAMTGVAASYIDSTPVLILSGQANTFQMKGKNGPRQRGIQEVDTLSLVRPITKSCELLSYSVETKESLEYLISLAKTGRKGPVWLDIPLDVQKAKYEENKYVPF